jgi:hypothetical protein
MMPPNQTFESPYVSSGDSWGGKPSTDAPLAVGSLKIKEPRSWKPWQKPWQLAAMFIAGLLVGFLLTYGGNTTTKASSSSVSHTLPPQSSSGTTTTTSAPSANTTTSTTTSTSPSTSTTGPTTGVLQVLVPAHQSRGSWTSPPFTITSGQWNIGWAYQCTPAPTSGPAFQVFIVPAGGTPGNPTVNESAGTGKAVTAETTPGSQQVQVQSPASCIWVVKVTGIG